MADRLTDRLFDPYFYAAISGETGDNQTLRKHFDTQGRNLGLSPGPLFDADWYLRKNPDVNGSGLTPYDHFQKWGIREDRPPNALFDPTWYRQRHLDARARTTAFSDFLTRGLAKGLRPGPFFWTDWYAARYDTDPKAACSDYLTVGWRAGRAPNPLFDLEHFRRAYGSVSGDPLEFFLRILENDQSASTHPLFDGARFSDGLNQRGLSAPFGAMHCYLGAETDAGLPDPHILFDAVFYRKQKGERCSSHALVDYLDSGPAALLDPHPLFSKSHYHRFASDVAQSGIDALSHFARSGHAEGREFHPLLNASRGGRISEYILQGRNGRLSLSKAEDPDHTLHPPSPLRKTTELPAHLSGRRRPPGAGSIGIFAHIFHTDIASELLEAAANSPSDRTKVFISTDTSGKAQDIQKIATKFLGQRFEIRVTPNRGRDIAPWLIGFADRLREVDIACHIHSKRSPQMAGDGDGWRDYLVDCNLGSSDRVNYILELLSLPGVGAVVPDHHPSVRNLISWGGNFETAQSLMQMLGETISREGSLDLPSGSMFWCLTDALRPLLDLNLDYMHFDPELGQIDGTLAHAIERCFLPIVEAAGFGYVTTKPVHKAAPGAKVSINRLRPMSKDLGPTAQAFPHTAAYLTRRSEEIRPRINLLIPTADRSRAYAGVSSALGVFSAIRNELGSSWDSRILSTDVPLRSGFQPPEGVAVAPLDSLDEAGSDVLVDASKRAHSPISIRRKDIFMSTAWWTALQAQALLRRQSTQFELAGRRQVYLIQDFEPGFEPWSTAWGLAESTYRSAHSVIPIFNTPVLAQYFSDEGYFAKGHVLCPPMELGFLKNVQKGARKEKVVLLYARPHASRNCLEFLDILVRHAKAIAPEVWRGWRFVAIGEDFSHTALLPNSAIEIGGRMSLARYAETASSAALAVSLMISPHPSYPPLEMAAAGVRVLCNRYGKRDSSELHENIESFESFDPERVARQLTSMALKWKENPDYGWATRPKVDWFFDGKSNLGEVGRNVAVELQDMIEDITSNRVATFQNAS